MRQPQPLPDSLGASFSVSEAKRAGVSARRLRHPGLDAPFWGVRARASTSTPEDDPVFDESPLAEEARLLTAAVRRLACAFAANAGEGCFFSHITAAVLWKLPVPVRELRKAVQLGDGQGEPGRSAAHGIDVAVLAPRRAPKGAGVNGHELAPYLTALRTVDGLRVTSPATTWAMLAPLLTVDELVRVGDAIVRIPRRRGMQRGDESDALGTREQLEAAMNAGRRHGVGRLRAALPMIRVGSASPGETDLRLACIRAGLPEPQLDIDVMDRSGVAIGYTELAYPAWRVLIEYEGDHHRTDRAQWLRDIDKHAACIDAGWTVIRLTSRHVYPTGFAAVTRIREALFRAGWRPAP